MNLIVSKSKIEGTILVPGSKSHTIRALAIAAMAKGDSFLEDPLISEDTISSLTAVSSLGAWVKRGDDSSWRISGTGGNILEPAHAVNMGDSGTGIKLLAAMASLSPWKITFDGDESLRSRPMSPLLDALSALGVTCTSSDGKCPFSVQGPFLGGTTEVEGKSSQYLSALLLAAPLAPQDTVIHVHKLCEIPYVDLTLAWLKKQKIKVKHDARYTRFEIEGRQKYAPFRARIPGDFSTAAFPLVAAVVTGGSLHLKNLDLSDAQGDKAIIPYLQQMGAAIGIVDDRIVVEPSGKLHAAELDLNATPDALPILCIAAACAEGTSTFRNVAQARIKETDRIHCMKMELEKIGIKAEEFEDGISVTGGRIKGASVDSHKDHRIAMALAVAGFAMKDSHNSMDIADAQSIAVTYPGFFTDFTKLGAKMNFR